MLSTKKWLAAGLAMAISLCLVTTVCGQEQATSPLVKQINNGNWLDAKEAEGLVDELYYQRAIYAYMTMLPALNVIGMRDGSEKIFGSGYNVLPIWKERMDSRAVVPTPNADVIYSMSYLDLKKTGPLVVKAPPNVPKQSDGSIEIWFGTEKPKDVVDAAFIRTIPVRNFFVAVRLYGAEDAFYDQTWQPDDIVKVK